MGMDMTPSPPSFIIHCHSIFLYISIEFCGGNSQNHVLVFSHQHSASCNVTGRFHTGSVGWIRIANMRRRLVIGQHLANAINFANKCLYTGSVLSTCFQRPCSPLGLCPRPPALRWMRVGAAIGQTHPSH